MKKIAVLIAVSALIVAAILFLESKKVDYSGEGITREEVSVLEAQQDNSNISNKFTYVDTLRIKNKGSKYPKAIELVEPEGYINTNNITIRELIGKQVILVDFWTYSCINCQRTLPYLTSWYIKYKDKGLVIIGVHTPEFEFEKEYDNVKRATEKFNVTYPVVQDNDYRTWQAYNNRYWPRKYIIDIDGFIVYDHIGEGAYGDTEMKIQELLKERAEVLDISRLDLPKIESSIKDEIKIRVSPIGRTPELYTGYEYLNPRGQAIGNGGILHEDESYNYNLPEIIPNDRITLDGIWLSNPENLRANGKSSILLNFQASSVNIVADTLSGPVEIEAYIDGKYFSPSQAGSDIRFDGDRSYFVVDHADLYNIIDGDYGRHTLKLSLDSSNFYFNSFTFG